MEVSRRWSEMIRMARYVLVEELRNERYRDAEKRLKQIKHDEDELRRMFAPDRIPDLMQLTIDWDKKNVEDSLYLPYM